MLDHLASRLIVADSRQRHWIPVVLLMAGVLLSAPAGANGRSIQTEAAGFTNVCTQRAPPNSAPSGGGVPFAPLVVGSASRIVVIEYEAWFGPRTGVFPQPGLTTCLQSTDMQSGGGGYDSSTAPVIAQHVAWFEQMGVDAVTVDLTNNVSCIYDGDNPAIVQHVCRSPGFRAQNLRIRDNSVRLYTA